MRIKSIQLPENFSPYDHVDDGIELNIVVHDEDFKSKIMEYLDNENQKENEYQVTLLTKETDEFICDMKITEEALSFLVEKGFTQVLEEQLMLTHKVEKVIFSNPATTVIFTDGKKVTVKTTEKEKFDPEVGFAMAYMNKLFGSRSAYKKFLKNWDCAAEPSPKRKKFLGIF
jgi:hypothetical protein